MSKPLKINWEQFIGAIPWTITCLDEDFIVQAQFNAENTILETAHGKLFLNNLLDPEERRRYQQQALHEAAAFVFETHFPEHERWYEHRGKYITDQRWIVVTSCDITERKLQEQRLKRLGRRYQAIFDNTTDGIAVSTYGTSYDDSELLEVNRRIEQIMGYTRAELLKTKPSMHLPDGELQFAQHRRRAQEQGDQSAEMVERRAKRKDGSVFYLESLALITDGDEAMPKEYIVLARDITERKLQEQRLREAQLTAEAALKTRDTFLANMSHQLRSPLNTLLVNLQMLSHFNSLPPAVIQHLRAIEASAEDLVQMIGDVLDLSLIEAGMDSLRPSTFELRSLLDRLYTSLRLQALRKQIHLRFEVDEALPTLVYMDEAKLKQILVQLIDNAIKFTEAGAVTVRIAFIDEGRLGLTVTDTGNGFSAVAHQHRYTPFVGSDESLSGIGIGLSITKRLVEIMDGRMEIHTEKGVGTIIRLELPLVIAQHESRPEPQAQSARSARVHADPHLLVVENREEDRQMLSLFLSKLGFDVETAPHAEEALSLLSHKEPDLIFTDFLMPRMDGMAFITEIRKRDDALAKVPIVVLTADATPQRRDQLLQAGSDEVIFKPYKLSDVVDVLARFLPLPTVVSPWVPQRQPADEPFQMPTAELLSQLPEDWLRVFHVLCRAGKHHDAREHLGMIEAQHPDIAALLHGLIERYWVAQIADAIAPLLDD